MSSSAIFIPGEENACWLRMWPPSWAAWEGTFWVQTWDNLELFHESGAWEHDGFHCSLTDSEECRTHPLRVLQEALCHHESWSWFFLATHMGFTSCAWAVSQPNVLCFKSYIINLILLEREPGLERAVVEGILFPRFISRHLPLSRLECCHYLSYE